MQRWTPRSRRVQASLDQPAPAAIDDLRAEPATRPGSGTAEYRGDPQRAELTMAEALRETLRARMAADPQGDPLRAGHRGSERRRFRSHEGTFHGLSHTCSKRSIERVHDRRHIDWTRFGWEAARSPSCSLPTSCRWPATRSRRSSPPWHGGPKVAGARLSFSWSAVAPIGLAWGHSVPRPSCLADASAGHRRRHALHRRGRRRHAERGVCRRAADCDSLSQGTAACTDRADFRRRA